MPAASRAGASVPAEAPPDGSGLPSPLSALIGRRADIEQVCAEFDGRRLVTLTGVGGCGKTRLALAVAEALSTGYADGARFVELTAVADPDAVAGTVAAALGIRQRPELGPLDLLSRHLRRARLLLVLDNCEHLIEASAGLAGALLGRCPYLHILATSREPLGIPGELAWPVPPLSVPADGGADGLAALRGHDSVRLFLDRASVAAVRELADADAPALAAICAGVDGLPLAIELAAARTRVLTVQEIAERIHDPALLRAAHVGSRPQHSALDATMDWSYQLLDPDTRARFRHLGVFTGGFTLARRPGALARCPRSGHGDPRRAGGQVADRHGAASARGALPDAGDHPAARVAATERCARRAARHPPGARGVLPGRGRGGGG